MSGGTFAQGIAALNAGDLTGAERILLAIVEQDALAHSAWHALSVVAVRAGLSDLGIERAQRAVALDKKNANYLNSLAIAYAEKEDLAAAEQTLRRALKLRPAFAEAHYNLGKVLRQQGRLSDAVKEYERAHALEPKAVATQLGLASIYRIKGEPERALAVLRAAAGDGVPDSDLIPYLSECLADVEGPEASLAWLRQLILREPQCRQAHHILGLSLLALGRLREGWPHYLWRAHWDAERMRTRPALLPEWLDGKRVFLRAEEGIGDVLFALRFAPDVHARGASLALECPPAWAKLLPLLKDRIAIDRPSAADVQAWLNDLPALLDTAAIRPPFALKAEESARARARERMLMLGRPPYLGLTWRAGTDQRRARQLGAEQAGLRLLYKELPVDLLGAAVAGWPGTIFNLQRAVKPAELQALSRAAGAEVHDLSSLTDDLVDALGVLAELDEYAAVISTNIHLLAGLGRSARVLAPRPLDWRWLRAEGESPWFPGFSVYRQPANFDWTGPLKRLREDLFARAEFAPRAPA